MTIPAGRAIADAASLAQALPGMNAAQLEGAYAAGVTGPLPHGDARGIAVLFPDREAETPGVATRRGEKIDASALQGIVVLDGTWSKAKTLWWRNPWLMKLHRMTLKPEKPSIYGRLRAEPRKDFVSTLESVAAALTLCGENPAIAADLERVFRTLVQRVRDAKLIAPRATPRRRRSA